MILRDYKSRKNNLAGAAYVMNLARLRFASLALAEIVAQPGPIQFNPG